LETERILEIKREVLSKDLSGQAFIEGIPEVLYTNLKDVL